MIKHLTGKPSGKGKGHGLIDPSVYDDQLRLSESFNVTMDARKLTPMEIYNIRVKATEMVVKDFLPYSAVQGDGFRDFVGYVREDIVNHTPNVLTRRGIARIGKLVFKAIKQDIVQLLAKNKSKFSLTYDMWTSRANESYLGITGHYIDEEWNLQSLVLDVLPVTHPHTAERIAEYVAGIIIDYGLEEKVVSVVTDNSANAVESVRELAILHPEWEITGNRCMAHILNLVCHAGLKHIGAVIENVRKIAVSIKVSTTLKEAMKKVSRGKSTIIPLDVKTRWNSTLHMLEGFAKVRINDIY